MSHDNHNLVLQKYTTYITNKVYTRQLLDGGTWSDWSDRLDNYLPLTGGTLSDTLSVKNIDASVVVKNDVRIVCLHLASNGTAGLFDTTNNKWILYSTKDATGIGVPGLLVADNMKIGDSQVLTTANVKYSNGVLDFYL